MIKINFPHTMVEDQISFQFYRKITFNTKKKKDLLDQGVLPGGGTDLERRYGDVRPWRPPFHASPAARKGPISSKRVVHKTPFEKIWKF